MNMRVCIRDNKVVITTEPEIIHFYLSKIIGKNLLHEINFVIKQNEFLADHTIKNKIRQLWSKISMETIFRNTENSKTNERWKFVLNLPQKLKKFE